MCLFKSCLQSNFPCHCFWKYASKLVLRKGAGVLMCSFGQFPWYTYPTFPSSWLISTYWWFKNVFIKFLYISRQTTQCSTSWLPHNTEFQRASSPTILINSLSSALLCFLLYVLSGVMSFDDFLFILNNINDIRAGNLSVLFTTVSLTFRTIPGSQ